VPEKRKKNIQIYVYVYILDIYLIETLKAAWCFIAYIYIYNLYIVVCMTAHVPFNINLSIFLCTCDIENFYW
jgi:hypothetical protein